MRYSSIVTWLKDDGAKQFTGFDQVLLKTSKQSMSSYVPHMDLKKDVYCTGELYGRVVTSELLSKAAFKTTTKPSNSGFGVYQ